ncbi:MAG: hypothetical protein IPJ07_23095 [Acidobacteria bacterium]|nr:hypothetical protein [Acidobacteriota bacterium]
MNPSHTPLFKSIIKLIRPSVIALSLTLLMLFMIASKATSFMPAVKAYGWKPVAQTLMDTSGKRLLNFVTAGRAYGNTYFFDPNPGLTKTLVPASPTAIPTGQTFTYRLTWRCAGSISPQDDCYNMRITDTLPPGIEFVSLPGVVAPVQSITGAGGGDSPVCSNCACRIDRCARYSGQVQTARDAERREFAQHSNDRGLHLCQSELRAELSDLCR